MAGDLISATPSARVTKSFTNFVADYAPDEIHGTCSRCKDPDRLEFLDTRTVVAIRSGGYGGTIRLHHNTIWSARSQPLQIDRRERQLADLGVAEVFGLYRFAPGWFATCAAEANSWKYPGILAIRLARVHRASVIVGGTRALGMIVDRAPDMGGQPTAVGIEVGTLARIERLSPRSWHQGFVVLTLNQDAVSASIVSINRDGGFRFGGTIYGP